ncbi:hypothetical protein PMAYCL1PPCAC_31574, partial [Pristionchus mayeri]
FMDPSALPKKMGRTPTEEEMKMKAVQFALGGLRAASLELDNLLKDADNLYWRSEAIFLRRIGEAQLKRKKNNKKKKAKLVSVSLDEESKTQRTPQSPETEERQGSPLIQGMSREERLQRLAEEASSLRSQVFSALSLDWEVKQAMDISKQDMIEAMRVSAEKVVRTCALPIEESMITEASLIAAMNTRVVDDVSIDVFDKAPEKPKFCSRTTWLHHVKMAKRLAGAIHQVCVAMNTGSSKTIDGELVCETLSISAEWMEEWEKGPLKVQLAHLVDHEIVKRFKELEYFFCYY